MLGRSFMCFSEIGFSIVFFVKPYEDGEMANRYRLKALVVTSHGPVHGWFGILTDFLSTSDIANFCNNSSN